MSTSAILAAPPASRPACTHEAITRLVSDEVGRLPEALRLSLGESFAERGIDAVAFQDVVHRIENRYQMRFRTDWLEHVDCWNDLVTQIERHLIDRLDRSHLDTTDSSNRADPETCVANSRPRAAAAAPARRLKAALTVSAREGINLTSTDYLGLAGHPDVVTAAKEAIDCFGCGVPTGERAEPFAAVVSAFERELASFLDVERAAIFPADHGPASAVFGRLVGEGDLVLLDRHVRGSLSRAAESSRATCRRFAHGDLAQLARLLRDTRGRFHRAVIVVEGLCSTAGDLADLPALIELKTAHECLLVVDESDALGTLGAGRGTAVHQAVAAREIDLLIALQWWSLGGGGGFIAGRDPLVRFLQTAESDLIGRPCPPAVVAAARASLAVIRKNRRQVAMLAERADLFRKLAADCDLDLAASASSDGPLLSVVLGGSYPGLVAARQLFERGVKAELVRHPSIPGLESRLRVRITLAHREEAIAAAVQAIAASIREA